MDTSCVRKSELLGLYSDAAKVYCELVSQLKQGEGLFTYEEYRNLYGAAQEARMRTEAKRLEYEGHIQEHKCRFKLGHYPFPFFPENLLSNVPMEMKDYELIRLTRRSSIWQRLLQWRRTFRKAA